ncbi:MAG: hypothetical protein HKN43_05730 [Rhodothermales bacterium]|nr:hypothetical protein [Rhodothermales bacterium]
MKWLKNAIVDVAVTIAIVVMVFTDLEWIYWVLAIYTGFMVLIKVVGLIGPAVKSKTTPETPPNWFYHVLYAINVGVLAWCQCWLLAGGWALIWILSIFYQRRRG